MSVEFIDNSEEILKRFHTAAIKALERCGMEAEGYAKDLVPVKTGNLRNSISHKVADKEAYVGTNSEYGPYVELGTGKYAEGGGGRPTPWVYQDSNGNWHRTNGQKAKPYLKPAVSDHKQTYQNIINDEMKNG